MTPFATPVVQCPGPLGAGCGTYLYVDAAACYGCGRLFEPRELWDAWEQGRRR